MYCDKCGTQLQESARFCPGCGKPFAAAPPPAVPSQGRISEHLRLLGILWIALSLLRLLPGLILIGVASVGSSFLPHELPPFVHALLPVIGTFFLIGGAAGIAAGWGLLERQPWARILTIVLSFFHILDIPFGTALGVYTLWVLWPQESQQEYQTLAHA